MSVCDPAKILQSLHYWNNLLLLPLFVSMALGMVYEGSEWAAESQGLELFFCASFLTEWVLAFSLAPDKRSFVREPVNILDLISSIPAGSLSQSFRIVRAIRVFRVLRLVSRAGRFKGKGSKLVRVAGLMLSVTVSGALAFRIVEPQSTSGFEESLWWSLITLSTVGYGDVSPTTPAGHAVGALVIISGIGVIGYAAGFMTSLMPDDTPGAEAEILARVKAIEVQLEQLALAHVRRSRTPRRGARR